MDLFITRLTTGSVNSGSARHETMIKTMSILVYILLYANMIQMAETYNCIPPF